MKHSAYICWALFRWLQFMLSVVIQSNVICVVMLSVFMLNADIQSVAVFYTLIFQFYRPLILSLFPLCVLFHLFFSEKVRLSLCPDIFCLFVWSWIYVWNVFFFGGRVFQSAKRRAVPFTTISCIPAFQPGPVTIIFCTVVINSESQ